MSTIYDKLREYNDSDFYGFHMPGHKRNLEMLKSTVPYAMDITEIEGFDDLHHAGGILWMAQKQAAAIYHADETHFLINGSTVGILSAVSGVTKRGDTVLVARNCHKSVYHAIYLNELNPIYLYPDFDAKAQLNGEVSPESVREALEKHPEIQAVILVSPTYDGVVSEVGEIVQEVHKKGIPLIVDEAHGAHFGFHPYFPENANMQGADIVIHSLHKTLPALTQTALLHMNGEIVNRKSVREYLHMLQSSSPSYVLMGSIDSCMDMLKNRREELFVPYVELLQRTRTTLGGLKRLCLMETEHYDRSKLVISVRNTDITSKQLYRELLDKYHLQLEMVAGTYVLAMTSVGDVKEGMDRLTEALFQIDAQIDRHMKESGEPSIPGQRSASERRSDLRLEMVYTSAAMANMLDETMVDGTMSEKVKLLPWTECIGHISTEYAYLYPPGSPLIVPGERITREAIDMLAWYHKARFMIEGLKEEGHIEVWMNG